VWGIIDQQLGGFRMSYDSDWLNLLKELTETASLITTSISISSLANSGDDDFFLYWFMERTLKIGRSVALLVEQGFYQEAAVAARTAAEAQFYLAEYRRNRSLAHKWRYFYIYEEYHEKYRDICRSELIREHKIQKEQNISDKATARANAEVVAKAAADKLLDHYRKTIGEDAVNEAQALFKPFESSPGQSWLGKKLKKLVKSLREDPNNVPEELSPELEDLLGDVFGDDPVGDLWLAYHRFSLVAHWNPSGVIWEGISDYANGALTATFEYLHRISTFVNDRHKLGYDNALNDIKERYNQKAALYKLGKEGVKT
jgi:hypothetical protein